MNRCGSDCSCTVPCKDLEWHMWVERKNKEDEEFKEKMKASLLDKR